MAYMLLIVEPPGQREERGREAGEQVYAQMLAFAEQLQQQGQLVAAQALSSPQTRLQQREGRLRVVDGPFAEAKEFVGGFFLLSEQVSREQALAIAALCPAAAWATVELRELGPCFL